MTKREIKFRAWIKKLNKYGKVLLIDWHTEEVMLDGIGWFSFDDVELEQYTGLKDANGVEICEGDIVRSGDTPEEIGKIEWDEYTAGFVATFCFSDMDPLGDFHVDQWEVIGNVHENLELLEV